MPDAVIQPDTHARLDPFKDEKTCKVAICEPSSGLVDAIVYDNRKDFWAQLVRLETRSNLKFFNWGTHRLHTSYARETCAENAIDSGMDYILFIDDDMIVPKNLFERLMATALETGAEMVAPLCTQRIHPYKPVLYKITVNEDVEKGQRFFHNSHLEGYEPNSVFEVDAVGFGVVLIKVDVLKRMKKPFFFSNASIGEDIWFCYKAREEAKAKIIADTRIKIGHMSFPPIITELDYVTNNGLHEKFKDIYGKFRKTGGLPESIAHENKGHEVVAGS